MIDPTPAQDLTGTIIATIGALIGIVGGGVAIFRTRGHDTGPIWKAIDETKAALRNTEKEIAREYARRQDVDEMKAILRAVDERSQWTKTTLEAIFHNKLEQLGMTDK